jgi:poly(3-hydroxybutyrate) depolymerase
VLSKAILKILFGAICLAYFPFGSMQVLAEGQSQSVGCSKGHSDAVPPFPFDVGDGNDYGQRRRELTVPSKCQCDGNDCTPCAIVVGFHGYSETGTSNHSWKSRLEPKGEAVGFISLYPTGDLTESNYFNWAALKKRRSRLRRNWAVPSCQDPGDGCLLMDGIPCDWCGSNVEDGVISTQREIDFTLAIIKWTMENHCVDPEQIFGTGFSNGGLLAHLLAPTSVGPKPQSEYPSFCASYLAKICSTGG